MNTILLYCILSGSLLCNLGLWIFLHQSRQRAKALLCKSRTDELTGILNRFACIDEINRHIRRSGHSGLQALFLIDLDNFKQINDTYGHRAGDEVLRFLAMQMKALFGQNAVLGRWGGDEFLIFLEEISCTEEAEAAARALGHVVSGEIPEVQEPVSISIGIVMANPDEDFSRLMQRADTALYYVKNHGKNNYHIQL